MSLTRRKFLRTGTAAVLFAGFSLGPLKTAFAQQSAANPQQGESSSAGSPYFQVPQEAKRDRVFYFTKSAFEPHLDTDFVVRAGVIVTTLRLVEVEDCASTSDESKDAGECFSLMFRADRPVSDLRTIHVFEHAALGEFNLFVSPTKKLKDPDGLYYVAVINHRVGADAPAPRTAPRQQQGITPEKQRP